MDRLGLAPGDVEDARGSRRGRDRTGSAAKPDGRALLGALLARGVALSPPDGLSAELHVAEALVWLAAHAAPMLCPTSTRRSLAAPTASGARSPT